MLGKPCSLCFFFRLFENLQDYQLRKIQRKKDYEAWLAKQPYDDEA